MSAELTKIILVCAIIAICTPAYSQVPGFAYDKKSTLCWQTAESDLVITGKIASKVWIVDPVQKKAEDERWEKTLDKPDFINLPKPEKFLRGSLYTVEVSDVLFDRSETDLPRQISLFVKGNRPLPLLDDNTPNFLTDTKYLIYLRALNTYEIEENSKTMNPAKREMSDFQIPATHLYAVTSNYYGHFVLNESNSGVLADAYGFAQTDELNCLK